MIPDAYYKDIYSINYKKLERIGIKYIFFDLDNTMINYYTNEVDIDLINFIESLKNKFKIIIFSNAREKRVKKISKELDVYAFYSSKKPLKKSYKDIKSLFKSNECIFIGDQFMTDVWGAKRNDMKVILVDRLSEEEPIGTKIWRFFEKKRIKRLNKNDKFELYRYYDNLV